MGLTPDQAARQITTTPRGQFALYDVKRGEVVKSDRRRPPDFRSLVKVAQTEQGKSEVSCVLEEIQRVVMAKPMIFSDETRPTHLPLPTILGCRLKKGLRRMLSLMNLVAPFRAICGLPIWKCHLVTHQPCHLLQSRHSNHIQMDQLR